MFQVCPFYRRPSAVPQEFKLFECTSNDLNHVASKNYKIIGTLQ